MIPKQLGPTSLISNSLHMSTSCFSSSAPTSSVSLNPAEITTRFFVPVSPTSLTAAGTKGDGMTTTARSTGP